MSKPRQFKSVSDLTPYEQKMHELKLEGFTWPEIAEKLNHKNHSTLRSHYVRVVKEKLELQEYENEFSK